MSAISIASRPLPAATDHPWRWRAAWARRAFAHELFGLRGVSLSRLAWAFAFVGLFALWSTVGNVLGGKRPGFCQGDAVDCFQSWILIYVLVVLPQALALTLADNLPLRGAMRVASLIAATLLATLALPVLTCTIHPDFGECEDFPSPATFAAFSGRLVMNSYYALLIFAIYLTRRRDGELSAALHASQLARVDAQRKTLEADLLVMQARVEPTFLFDALRDIGALYESDHRRGDRLLDQLIQYLRAALPDMRASGSTVGKEAELLRAYLNILAIGSAGRLNVATHVGEGVADAAVPPMMLVPLLAPSLDARIAVSPRDGSIRVDIRKIDGRLRIAIAATGDIARLIVSPASAQEVRGRLAALFGARASLVVDRRAGDRLQMILEIPQ